MKKRGISPLIASVLMISFVILLFILISTWVRKSAIEPSMSGAEEKLAGALDCINTKIEIIKVCNDSATNMQISVDNMGDTTLIGLGLRIIGSEVSDMINIDQTASPFGRIVDNTVTFTNDYGEITDWEIEIYPKIASGTCRDTKETFSITDC